MLSKGKKRGPKGNARKVLGAWIHYILHGGYQEIDDLFGTSRIQEKLQRHVEMCELDEWVFPKTRFPSLLDSGKGENYFEEIRGTWKLSVTVRREITDPKFRERFERNRINTLEDLAEKVRNHDNIIPESQIPIEQSDLLRKKFDFSLPSSERAPEWLNHYGLFLEDYLAGYFPSMAVNNAFKDLSMLWKENQIVVTIADSGSGKTTLGSLIFQTLKEDKENLLYTVSLKEWAEELQDLKKELYEAIYYFINDYSYVYVLIDDVHLNWLESKRIIENILRFNSKVRVLGLARPHLILEQEIEGKRIKKTSLYKFPKDYAEQLLYTYIKEMDKNILDYKRALIPLLNQDSKNIFHLFSIVNESVRPVDFFDEVIFEIKKKVGNRQIDSFYCIWSLFILLNFSKYELTISEKDFLHLLKQYSPELPNTVRGKTIDYFRSSGLCNEKLISQDQYQLLFHPYLSEQTLPHYDKKLQSVLDVDDSEIFLFEHYLKNKTINDYKRIEKRLEDKFQELDLSSTINTKSFLDSVKKDDYVKKFEAYSFLIEYTNFPDPLKRLFSKSDVQPFFSQFYGITNTNFQLVRDLRIQLVNQFDPELETINQIHFLENIQFYTTRKKGPLLYHTITEKDQIEVLIRDPDFSSNLIRYLQSLDDSLCFYRIIKIMDYIDVRKLDKFNFDTFSSSFVSYLMTYLITNNPSNSLTDSLEVNKANTSTKFDDLGAFYLSLIEEKEGSLEIILQNMGEMIKNAIESFELHNFKFPHFTYSYNVTGLHLNMGLNSNSKRNYQFGGYSLFIVPSKREDAKTLSDEYSKTLTIKSIKKIRRERKIEKILQTINNMPHNNIMLNLEQCSPIGFLYSLIIVCKEFPEYYAKLNENSSLKNLVRVKIEQEIRGNELSELFLKDYLDNYARLQILLDFEIELVVKDLSMFWILWESFGRSFILILHMKELKEYLDKRILMNWDLISKNSTSSQNNTKKQLKEVNRRNTEIETYLQETRLQFVKSTKKRLIDELEKQEVITLAAMNQFLKMIVRNKVELDFAFFRSLEEAVLSILKTMTNNHESLAEYEMKSYYSMDYWEYDANLYPGGVAPLVAIGSVSYKQYATIQKYEINPDTREYSIVNAHKAQIWNFAIQSNLAECQKENVYAHYVSKYFATYVPIDTWTEEAENFEISLFVTLIEQYVSPCQLIQIPEMPWIDKIRDKDTCLSLLRKLSEHEPKKECDRQFLSLLRFISLKYRDFVLKMTVDGDKIAQESYSSLCYNFFSSLITPTAKLLFLGFLSEEMIEIVTEQSIIKLAETVSAETISSLLLTVWNINEKNTSAISLDEDSIYPYIPARLYKDSFFSIILKNILGRSIAKHLLLSIDFSSYKPHMRIYIYFFIESRFEKYPKIIEMIKDEHVKIQVDMGTQFVINPAYYVSAGVGIHYFIDTMYANDLLRTEIQGNFQDILIQIWKRGKGDQIKEEQQEITRIGEMRTNFGPKYIKRLRVSVDYILLLIDKLWDSLESFKNEISWADEGKKALYEILMFGDYSREKEEAEIYKIKKQLFSEEELIQYEREQVIESLFYEDITTLEKIFLRNNDSLLTKILKPLDKIEHWNWKLQIPIQSSPEEKRISKDLPLSVLDEKDVNDILKLLDLMHERQKCIPINVFYWIDLFGKSKNVESWPRLKYSFRHRKKTEN